MREWLVRVFPILSQWEAGHWLMLPLLLVMLAGVGHGFLSLLTNRCDPETFWDDGCKINVEPHS